MSDWYYAANNEQKGPINESELKANFAANKLPADTLVWKDGMDNWTPANQVPAFTFRPRPRPPRFSPPSNGPTVKAAPRAQSRFLDHPRRPDEFRRQPRVPRSRRRGRGKEQDFRHPRLLGILCLVPILAAKDSPFAKYHANQGLVLFLLEIVL